MMKIVDRLYGDQKASVIEGYNKKVLLKRAGEPSEVRFYLT